MRDVTLTIHSLGELSPEARAKAIEAHRDINTFGDWYRDLHEDFARRIAGLGFVGRVFLWTLCPPGRGFWCHDMEVTDLGAVLRAAGLERTAKFDRRNYVTLYFKGNRNKNCRNRFLVLEHDKDERARVEGALNRLLDNLFEGFLGELDEEHRRLTSDEAVAETIAAQGTEFVASGERWPAAWSSLARVGEERDDGAGGASGRVFRRSSP